LLRNSTAIVTLTQLQADDLRATLFNGYSGKPIEVITTCADYEEFNPTPVLTDAVPEDVRGRLMGKLIVGLVGSINASYCLHESILLFKFLLEERADAHLLCLTKQRYEMRELLKQQGLPESAYTLATVPHREIASWMRCMDWALLLLNTRYSKRGSMPTKLGEFFAAGVRPIQFGCNEEVSDKVREAGSGIVLDGLAVEDLRQAASKVAAMPLQAEEIMRARELTRPHFSLQAGVEKYKKLFNQISCGNRQ
jgi:glycosyltransferase involved in cell wall biosynthesis